MIELVTAAGGLDLAASTTISLEVQNPLFRFDSVPGTTSYSFSIPWTPRNLINLNFPHVRAAQGEKIAPEPTGFIIDGVLWRQGSLLYNECDELKRTWQYTFAAGAADLQARIEGRTLRQLELGQVSLELRPDAADYALPMVSHKNFYGEKNLDYQGLLNSYQNGAYQLSSGGKWQFPIVPFPRLVPLLRRALGALGYRVSGPWLEEAAELMVYSDRAVEVLPEGATVPVLPVAFALQQHVPDLGVGEFLVSLQKLFGLGYDFHPVRSELRIVRLRDVVGDAEYVERQGSTGRTLPAEGSGFLLKMGLEDDELNKRLDTSWAQLRVGSGKQVIETAAGTLHIVGGQPAMEAKGSSPAFEAGTQSRAGLRLLYDQGASKAGVSLPGRPTLAWSGAQGLYEQNWRPWLEFLDRAGQEERTMEFRVADLLTLDPKRKEMVGARKYLWEKVSVSVSNSRRLESARFTYRPIKR